MLSVGNFYGRNFNTSYIYTFNELKKTNFIYGKTHAVYITTYQKQNPNKGYGISKKYCRKTGKVRFINSTLREAGTQNF
jgi:hypothetical protein